MSSCRFMLAALIVLVTAHPLLGGDSRGSLSPRLMRLFPLDKEGQREATVVAKRQGVVLSLSENPSSQPRGGLRLLSCFAKGNSQTRTLSPSARQVNPLSSAEFESLKRKAESAKDSNRIPEAIRLYQQIVARKSDWAEGWWYLGTLHYDADQFSLAESAFSHFTSLQPDGGHGWGMLGLCEFRVGRYVPALDHIVKARSLGLGDNEDLARVLRYHQAVLLNMGKQFESAQELLNGFAVEKKDSVRVLEALGMSVLHISERMETLSDAQKPMIHEFGRAAFLAGAKRVEESRKLYDELEVRYRGAPNVAYALGMSLLAAGEGDRAIGFFRMELERDPDHVDSLLKLAFHSLNSGRSNEGLPYANKALNLEPENFAVHYTLGRIYMELDEISRAIAALEKAARIAPSIPSVYFVLARACRQAQRPADAARARAEFARLEELDQKRHGTATMK